MNRLALQFANGSTFFYGITISLLACMIGAYVRKPHVARTAGITAIFGAILVILSGNPLPTVMYCIWIALLLASCSFVSAPPRVRRLYVHAVLGLFAVQSVLMCAVELPFHRRPKLPLPTGSTLCVIGDSLSMGADTQARNWPYVLGSKAGLKVANMSFGGAKVRSALSNARRLKEDDAYVILEIGGNDILFGTGAVNFESDLEQMLSLVCQPNRTVVMFELPLPPFYNRYGMAQRRLAKAYGVSLIPKRYLAYVLGAPNATLDGLHLSHTGHALLAETIWPLMESGSP